MVPTHPYRAASYNGRVLRCSTACNHIANTWLVVCSTHAAAASKNFGANLDMMAVHAPIVLIPGLPNSARHDVLRRGTRCAPWLLHVLEGVPGVVVRAARMINGNHDGIKPTPKFTTTGRDDCIRICNKPWFESSSYRHTSHHQWPEDPSMCQERAVGHQVFVNLHAEGRHRCCNEPVYVCNIAASEWCGKQVCQQWLALG